MKRFFAILIAAVIPPVISAPAVQGKGDILSISVTNKYGDVFTNLTVVQVVTNGLVLEHKTGQLKVKFEDLPKEVRNKYQPIAAEAAKQELKHAEANTDYAARKLQLQIEAVKARELKEQQDANMLLLKSIDVPYQGWKIVVPDTGLVESEGGQSTEDLFTYQATGKDGFGLSILVENPQGEGTEDDDVVKFFWPQISRNPNVVPKSVRAIRTKDFIRVSYIIGSSQHSDFFFAFRGKWAVVQIAKTPYSDADAWLFNIFDGHLSYN
jgi:hypothetical protein